ncbi:UDP-N-acetylglucosamine 1-carboxyvinyltransferase 1 [Thermoclostridium stercorarium subsp. stercorarium DSM 8532]|jgi:UDP-N-acetylglucosamine 1-carboxyvinyltransferase|uniref:UDP-N-acetylglucosamine 1-carboxyvinyltransferase n=3 Tax=Thermoclostridium stercorarium TaxID=1510 RepID=L7VLL8_THES1|nr:UDP-N-acetylglucosamine 1-carboxyvinyltransferase [Thermoclostridium stercorarium]AGC67396.1 UDP-N-acetylglucosamine 1-carboxyvinyltransferase 1 [Thermoclostridium stercorarium subsp. stercorarium DSM 8532]AGI38457.1 UDP-N-acetylglucosamine 1-carboxyvinyltransferase [Thermoclostridium stercorarium subsp. stercorarium DSM 8532]ANW97887.1 UDP-N-acetylglucosamine 1-carboxyvinyltransferase [Thermoclostridium stercorarium subsp. thermolacticum DSM 2910]ANX00439.1 UDP-N-acetylglucosamine 1-carboxy
MSVFLIDGGIPLKGTVRISGAKNAILPALAACLLTDGKTVLKDVPNLEDVHTMCNLLASLGARVNFNVEKREITIETTSVIEDTAPYELVNTMRASFLVMGPLLARKGRARVPLPGGCAIGSRPVDLHLKGFSALGATITTGHGYVEARVNGRLTGARIYLDFPSVGATENILMAAVLAKGQTVIENAASEPEIVDLATMLVSMGANVTGAGTDTIRVIGTDKLHPTEHMVIPDRIEAGTYMLAAAMTGGEVNIENTMADHLKPVIAKLREAGVEITEEFNRINVRAVRRPKAVDVKTHPYPGFPTDMQAQMTAFLSQAEGTSMVVETIFENRFMHINELKRMGARIKIDGRTAIIEGGVQLMGAQVRATDLRAGAALVLAGLCAKDRTEISEIHHVDRGYEAMEQKLRALGARIVRV